MTLFISNSESSVAQNKQWRSFIGYFLGVVIAGLLGTFLFITLLDPFGVVSFSLPITRVPISPNQRFSYPLLARDPSFDSVVIGTSTIRLLKPELLNKAFNANFVNLAFNSATAYEQSRMLSLFLQNREKPPKYIIIGIDIVWALTDEKAMRSTKFNFPDWMYNSVNPTMLLHLLNKETLRQAVSLAQYLFGIKTPPYGPDGYANFLPDENEYDMEKARVNIYGTKDPKPFPDCWGKKNNTSKSIHFPVQSMLKQLLAELPAETEKIILFVPYHAFNVYSDENTANKWSQCKQKIRDLCSGIDNVTILDFMIVSEITKFDNNYWDPLHYKVGVATQLPKLIHQGFQTRKDRAGYFRFLGAE